NRKYFEDIKWVCDRTNDLEDDRNNAIHAPLWASLIDKTIHPSSTFGNLRARNLEKKHLREEYERLLKAALMLRNFASDIFEASANERYAWPRRPQLPSREATKKSQLPLPAQSSKRPPQ